MNVKVEPLRLVIELAHALDTQYGLQKLKDKSGNLIIPIDNFPDFCHDVGLMVEKILDNVAELEKGTEE